MSAAKGCSRSRSVIATAPLLVGLLLSIGLLGHWAHRAFVDTERYVETVGPLADDPAVQEAVAQALLDSLVTTDGVSEQVLEGSPNAPERLVTTMSAAVVGLVDQVVRKVVVSAEFAEPWRGADKSLQSAVILVLEGQPPEGTSVRDGDVNLDLDTVREEVVRRVEARCVTLPTIDAGSCP